MAYLLAFLLGLVYLLWCLLSWKFTAASAGLRLPFGCGLAGGFGGCTYCLRAVYLQRCVRGSWSSAWGVWYLIRPLVSTVCGVVAFIFLRAGLLVLRSHTPPGGPDFGFYALAFIAGLNVDRFLEKVEALAEAAWGIKKSRAANGGSDTQPVAGTGTGGDQPPRS